MPKAFPIDFRTDVVAVARKGEASIAQVAEDFGVSESCLQRRLELDDVEAGKRPGTSRDESAELRELRKRTAVRWGGCYRGVRGLGARARAKPTLKSVGSPFGGS